jgi:hypothetical protein
MGACIQTMQLQRQPEVRLRHQTFQGRLQAQIHHAPVEEKSASQKRRLRRL